MDAVKFIKERNRMCKSFDGVPTAALPGVVRANLELEQTSTVKQISRLR